MGTVRRRSWVVTLAGLVTSLFLAGSVAGAQTPDDAVFDDAGFQECLDARPPEVDVMAWSCVSYDGVWTPQERAHSPLGGGFGTFLTIAVLWSAIPLAIAASMASSRDESVAAAVGLTLVLGWVGLAVTYVGQRRTREAIGNLRAPTGPASARSGASPARPTAPEPSAGERLRELAALRDQGLIDEAEHDRQRRRILDTI